jgi:spermidine/putrescine transport system substrate-binding protein
MIALWTSVILGILYLPKFSPISTDSKTINIFSWGDILDPAIIANFEKETGIKVRMSYYASNEELIVKMKATRGDGYDLIIPSDYAVNILVQDNLLRPIDKKSLNFLDEINPNLLGHHFDPDNTYSIPLEWELFGFGIDKRYVEKNQLFPSWKLIFDKRVIDYKISMTNDPIEATSFASFYLYGNRQSLDSVQIEEVKNLLIQQKSWVEAYANFRGDYFLATGNCPVVVASSSYIWKTMRQFPFVSFVTPKEGTFIAIENIAIPAAAKNEQLTYQFINYLFRHESVLSQFHKFGFFPSTLHSLSELEIDPAAKQFIQATAEQFEKFHFIHEVTSQERIHEIWVDVKSSSN